MDVTAIGEILIDLTQTGVNVGVVAHKAAVFVGRPGGEDGGAAAHARRQADGAEVEDLAPQHRVLTIPLPLVDIIKLSEEELPLLAGTADLGEGTRILEEPRSPASSPHTTAMVVGWLPVRRPEASTPLSVSTFRR